MGIITETDIFKVFLEMLGGRDDGVRVSVQVPHKKGVLALIAGEIEFQSGAWQVKDLARGAQQSVAEAELVGHLHQLLAEKPTDAAT